MTTMSNLRLATSNPIAVLAEVFGFSKVEAAMNKTGLFPTLKVEGLALAHLVSGICGFRKLHALVAWHIFMGKVYPFP